MFLNMWAKLISHVLQQKHIGRGVGQGGRGSKHLKPQTGFSGVVVGFGAAAARLNTANSAERVM